MQVTSQIYNRFIPETKFELQIEVDSSDELQIEMNSSDMCWNFSLKLLKSYNNK
jgi:hypothetical protein